MPRYMTRQQLRLQLEDCHLKVKTVALVALVLGFLLGKFSA